MARNFNVGRQKETLLNDEHFDIFKILEYYNASDSNNSNNPGPKTKNNKTWQEACAKNALWLDNYNGTGDLRYFDKENNKWKMVFEDKFKIFEHLLDIDEPTDPINKQLWIDNGQLKYYKNGEWLPIKAQLNDVTTVATGQMYEDFLLVSPLSIGSNSVVDNLDKSKLIGEWTKDITYKEGQQVSKDLFYYECLQEHTSSDDIDTSNTTYWKQLKFATQMLVPNANTDKIFLNGSFYHQDTNNTNDGWKYITNISIQFINDYLNNKTASCVHVNPTRLNNIEKNLIKIDKESSYSIIDMSAENTEFYGLNGALGTLLIKNEDYYDLGDYIQLSSNVVNSFDFIYAIKYEFTTSSIKTAGTLSKDKMIFGEENSIWIGDVEADRLCVFAQGLYFTDYTYDKNTGYLTINAPLQDPTNTKTVKKYDFSVLAFPKVYKTALSLDSFSDTYPDLGYRVVINSDNDYFVNDNILAFLVSPTGTLLKNDIIIGPESNKNIFYIPSITKEFVQNNPDSYIAIAQVIDYGQDDIVDFDMWRGVGYSSLNENGEVVVKITHNKEEAENDTTHSLFYFAEDDLPIMFVDGVLVFQQDIEIENDCLKIYGLKENQEIVLLGDKHTDDFNDLSDNLIFEDTISYSTIPIPRSDSVIVYIDNGIVCDASSVYTTSKPAFSGYNNQIKQVVNSGEQKWLIYNKSLQNPDWEEITDTAILDVLNSTCISYSSTKTTLSFLQNFENDTLTYYGYKYADSIEKPLRMNYIYPNGKTGTNTDPVNESNAFTINYKDSYTPGKNELTVYWNGIRQNLVSPNEANFNSSLNRECNNDFDNRFTLCIDNNTAEGQAIKRFDGYYIYQLKNEDETLEYILNLEEPITDAIIEEYQNKGYTKINTISTPTQNVLFYVIERCETGESMACQRYYLTYKDALANNGAYSNIYSIGTDSTKSLTKGHVRVFINGIRQPYGTYKIMGDNVDDIQTKRAYSILNSHTIQFEDVLIGSNGGNYGTEEDPKFKLGTIKKDDGTEETVYYNVIDNIVIETRNDYKIREITIPILDSTGVFTINDGLPETLFKSKDKITIFINGLAYGCDYKLDSNSIILTNPIMNYLGSGKNVITFEWR